MSEFETIVIRGRFVHTLFHNETNAYTVARFRLYEVNEKMTTVTGYIRDIDKEAIYNLTGHYTEHPKYGMQFVFELAEKQLPSDAESIISYLAGPVFPGIGKKYALTILETLGENCLERIKADPEVLNLVPKMNEKKKKSLIDGICHQDDLQEAIEFFSTHGLGIRNIMRLDQKYGKEALNKVKENPYRLVEECDGIGFKTADKLAMNMGISEDDPRRMEAALLSLVLEECVKTGDSYIELSELEMLVEKEFGSMMDLAIVLDELCIRHQLVVEENRVYHYTQYDAEEFIATYFATPLSELYDPPTKEEVAEHLQQFEEEIGIEYDEKQKEAIETFFEKEVTILTGGPGTGKSTVVRAMVEIFRRLYPYYSFAVCAPTGRASKRLTELTGVQATTIHRLLRWDLESNTFTFDGNNPLTQDLLIVDETSMVDQWLFYHLLDAGRSFKKILIIGDEDQLPSVGIGAVLRDLIATDRFSLVRLEKIFRQKEGSGVIELAHSMKDGILNLEEVGKEVMFIECDQYQAKNAIVELVSQALNKGYDINDIQVLSPKYSGVCGIDGLNVALQKVCNPPDKYLREIKVGYRTYREGDKILQLKNQPDDDVYNGDIGRLMEIVYAEESDTKNTSLLVDFDGIPVEYTPEYYPNITHAYCVSIHKAQGSEYPIIILPILKSDQFMLSRRLIYTAITRASKSLIILGQREALEKGIATSDLHQRKTTLSQRILEHKPFIEDIK